MCQGALDHFQGTPETGFRLGVPERTSLPNVSLQGFDPLLDDLPVNRGFMGEDESGRLNLLK